MCTIGDLPDEVLVDVFGRLDCADLYAGAGAVSVRWKGIAADVMTRAEPVCARRARAADPAHIDYVGPYITNLIGDAAADWRLYAHDPQCRYRGHACLCAARNDRIAVLDVLCRMLGHPWVPAACVEAASCGRLGILAYAATHRHPYDQGACEAAAAAAKQRVVLDWLWESHPPTRASADRAAESGDIALLRLLQTRRCPRGESTMAAAARGGHVDVVQWLMRRRCPWDATAILAAARAGSVDVLRLLLAQYDGRVVATHAIQAAVAGRDVACVDLLWARCLGGGDDDIVDPTVGQAKAPAAASRGRAKIRAGHDENTRDRVDESNGTGDVVTLYGPRWVILAARHGDIAMLDRLCSRGCTPTPKAMAAAAGAGNMNALIYLRRRGCPWDAQATAAAAAHGRLDVLDYLFRHGCPWDATTCTAAAGGGHLECLAYAHGRGCPWDREVYVAALGHGHAHIIRYAHQQDCPRDRTVCRAATAAAAAAGPSSDAVRFVRQEVCRHHSGRCDLKPKVGRRRAGPASSVPFSPILAFYLFLCVFYFYFYFFKTASFCPAVFSLAFLTACRCCCGAHAAAAGGMRALIKNHNLPVAEFGRGWLFFFFASRQHGAPTPARSPTTHDTQYIHERNEKKKVSSLFLYTHKNSSELGRKKGSGGSGWHCAGRSVVGAEKRTDRQTGSTFRDYNREKGGLLPANLAPE